MRLQSMATSLVATKPIIAISTLDSATHAVMEYSENEPTVLKALLARKTIHVWSMSAQLKPKMLIAPNPRNTVLSVNVAPQPAQLPMKIHSVTTQTSAISQLQNVMNAAPKSLATKAKHAKVMELAFLTSVTLMSIAKAQPNTVTKATNANLKIAPHSTIAKKLTIATRKVFVTPVMLLASKTYFHVTQASAFRMSAQLAKMKLAMASIFTVLTDSVSKRNARNLTPALKLFTA